jgi:hypothetical protein
MKSTERMKRTERMKSTERMKRTKTIQRTQGAYRAERAAVPLWWELIRGNGRKNIGQTARG